MLLSDSPNVSYPHTLLKRSNPAMTAVLYKDLDAQRFSAVVLEQDPHSDRGRALYSSAFFGEGFIERMERSYVEAGRVKSRVVYVSKPR